MGEKIFIPELWEENNIINYYKLLDDKVDIFTFASLSKDVQWLLENHVTPNQHDTHRIDLNTKVNKDTYKNQIDDILLRVSAIESKLLKLASVKTITTLSRSGYIADKITNDHLLFEVSTFTIILPIMFTFNTSDTQEWHDLQHHKIRGVLGYAYVKIVDDIERNKKKIILHTYNNDWMRKPIFTNYYSLRYTFEYITTEYINLY